MEVDGEQSAKDGDVEENRGGEEIIKLLKGGQPEGGGVAEDSRSMEGCSSRCSGRELEASTLSVVLPCINPSTDWRTDAKWVLAIRQANTTTLNQSLQRVAVQFVQRFSRIAHIFKLNEAHRSVVLLTETKAPKTGSGREQFTQTILEIVLREPRRRW